MCLQHPICYIPLKEYWQKAFSALQPFFPTMIPKWRFSRLLTANHATRKPTGWRTPETPPLLWEPPLVFHHHLNCINLTARTPPSPPNKLVGRRKHSYICQDRCINASWKGLTYVSNIDTYLTVLFSTEKAVSEMQLSTKPNCIYNWNLHFHISTTDIPPLCLIRCTPRKKNPNPLPYFS